MFHDSLLSSGPGASSGTRIRHTHSVHRIQSPSASRMKHIDAPHSGQASIMLGSRGNKASVGFMATSSWTPLRAFRRRGPAQQSGQIVPDLTCLLHDLVNLMILLIPILFGRDEEHDPGKPAGDQEGPAAPQGELDFATN